MDKQPADPSAPAPVRRKPWEQFGEEPDAAYNRFLAYLQQGPGRSQAGAKKGGKGRAPSGAISRLAREWSWVERVRAWDRDNLARGAEAASVRFVAALELIGDRVIETLRGRKKLNSREMLELIQLLGTYATPEVINRALAASDIAGPRAMSESS